MRYTNKTPHVGFIYHPYMRNKNPINKFLAPNEIITCIDWLKWKHSVGHDNVTSVLLKDKKYETSFPIAILINNAWKLET